MKTRVTSARRPSVPVSVPVTSYRPEGMSRNSKSNTRRASAFELNLAAAEIRIGGSGNLEDAVPIIGLDERRDHDDGRFR